MGKQILHIASGIPPDSSGTGRLLSHLISQAPSEPDWDIRFHYPRRPVGSRRAMIKQRRVVEAALDWLRVGLSWNVLRLKLAWLSLFGRGRILFFHPQTLGFRRTLRYLRAWRGRAFLFGLDNSFFCVRSYNHVRGEAAPCLRCLGGRFEAAEEMACSPFPVPDDAAFAYVRALRELLSDGAVNVLAQNEANAELYRRHTDGRAQVQVVGLWTADWTPLFTSSAPQPAEGGFDVVFHSHFVPAKGAEWMLEVARHLPQARILYPTPLPRGAGPAPDNVVFKRMTWETGLAEEASKAKIVCVPSVWSATIEGALIKSIITGKAAARVRAEGAYGEELPDGLVLDLDPNPAAAARTLADALAKGWQPEEGLRTAWIASFQRENFALLKHLLRAIKPSAAREDTPAAVAGIAPPEPAAAAEDPPLPEPAPAANGRDIRLEKLGTTYGGWKVPVEHIDERWTCYCVGAGEDISFDCALIERFGCDVYVFDPTPRSVDHVAELSRRVAAGQEMPVNNNPEVLYTLPPDKLHRLHFRPYGVWSQNTTQRFYKPKNSAHVSHSILNLQKTEDYIEAECRTLASLMQELGHSRIDLLKIDVEGAEYEVLKSMLADGIAPRVLCVEFDEGNQPLDDGAPDRIARTIADLQAAGFALVEQDGWNAIFVRPDELAHPPEAR